MTIENNGTETKQLSGAGEWGEMTLNICKGCSNNCKYCYARADASRRKQIDPNLWKDSIVKTKYVTKGYRNRNKIIMFPSTHDITPENIDSCLTVLEKLLKSGNRILIVSKPHFDCISKICDNFSEYKNQMLFRFTIGSFNNDVIKFWEPGATTFEERFEALKYAFSAGYKTSVSMEPFLDNNAVQLVEKLRPYVTDSIWIGKVNDLIMRLKQNNEQSDETLEKAYELIELHNSEYIFDLYNKFKNDPLIQWKESLKKEFGIPLLEKPLSFN